jgi:hypothetical protein
MPEDGQYGRNMQHVLTKLIQFVMADRQHLYQFQNTLHFVHRLCVCYFLMNILLNNKYFPK